MLFRSWPSPDIGHDLRALGLPRGLIGLLVHSVSHNAARRPVDALDWKERLETMVTRSDSLPPPGVPTPAPGTLNVADSGISPGIR